LKKDQGISSLVIILLILTTLSLDDVWISSGENLVGHQWDLEGFKITFSYQGNLDDCQCEYQNTKYGLTVETWTKSKETCETAAEKIHKGHFGPGNGGFHWKVYVSQSPLILARLIIRMELGAG